MEIAPPLDTSAFRNATSLGERAGFFGRRRPENLTDQQLRIHEQRRNPINEAVTNQEAWPPPIEDGTRATLARAMVREYRSMMNVLKRTPPGVLEPWQKNYRDIMEQQFREHASNGDLLNASDDELYAAFKTSLTNEQYVPMAIKIAEAQQEAMEVASTVNSVVGERNTFLGGTQPMDIEERKYIPVAASTSARGDMEVLTPNHDRDSWLRRFIRNPISTALRVDVYGHQDRRLAREGRKRWNLPHAAVFAADATLDVDRQYGMGQHLSEVQKEFIRSQLKVTGLTVNGESLQNGAKEEINNELNLMIAARMNVAAHHDQLMTGRDLNMVEVRRDVNENLVWINEFAPSTRRVTLRRYEGLGGMEMVIGQEGRFSREVFLEQITDRIRTSSNEAVAKALKETLTIPVVEDQIRVLETQTQPRNHTQQETDQINRLNTEKGMYTADTAVVDEIEASTNAIGQLNRDIALIDAQIDPRAVNYLTPGNPEEIAPLEKQSAIETREIAALETRIADVKASRDGLSRMLGDPKQNAAALQTRIDALDTQLNHNVTGLYAVLKTKQNTHDTTLDIIASRRAVVATNQGLIDEKKAKEAQRTNETRTIARLQDQLNNAKKLDGVTQRYANPADRNAIRTEIRRVETENAEGVKTIEASVNPDRFKMRQLDVLRTFLEKIAQPSTDVDIQNRANQRADGIEISRRLDEAERIYPGMDRTYLRTMQILFSDTATLDTTEGRQSFLNGFRMISPEAFSKLAAAHTPPITTAADIDGLFMNEVLDHLHAEARVKRLGQMDPVHEQRVRQLEAVIPVDIVAERAALQTEQEAKLTAYAAELENRKNRIKTYVDTERAAGTAWVDITNELNTNYFEGNPVLTPTMVQDMDTASRTPPPANRYDSFMPDKQTVKELSELLAVNRDRESRQIFLIAAEQIMTDPVMFTAVETRMNAGESVESILSNPAFAAQQENLIKAMTMGESGNTILAGLSYLLAPDTFATLESGLRQGKTMTETIPDFDPTTQTYITFFMENCASAVGARSLADIQNNDGVTKSMIAHIDMLRPQLRVGGLTDPVLTRLVSASQGVENRISLEQKIQNYANFIPYDEGVDDLTARIVYDYKLEANLAYAKMLAQEVINYRNRNRPTA